MSMPAGGRCRRGGGSRCGLGLGGALLVRLLVLGLLLRGLVGVLLFLVVADGSGGAGDDRGGGGGTHERPAAATHHHR